VAVWCVAAPHRWPRIAFGAAPASRLTVSLWKGTLCSRTDTCPGIPAASQWAPRRTPESHAHSRKRRDGTRWRPSL